jgi:uncharacterized protein YbjQ (UPF0145 family)
MDLTALSDQDFSALQAGDLAKMSDAGFAQLLKAQDAAEPRQAKIDKAAARAKEQNDPTKLMTGGELLAAGAGKFINDIGLAARQAMPGSSVTRQTVDEQKALDAPLMKTWQGKTGYMGGAALASAPLMLAPGANTMLGSAAYGAGMGALSPVGTGDSVLQNAGFGAAGGFVGAGIAKAGSRVLAPKPQAGTQGLIDADIVLTPGQRLGGAWKRGEDAMTSMPFTGDFIRSQQRRTFEEFNAAVANKALKPINSKLPKGVVGRDAIAYTEKAIGDAYESVLNRVGTVRADPAFNTEIANLTQMVRGSTMPADVQAQFNKAIQSQIKGKLQGQSAMTAETFKQAESELGRLASLYGADASVDKQLLGDALQEAQAALRRMLERSAGPRHAADVKAANAGWAEFKRMQRAASMQGAKDGVFSPEQYMNAVKALDPSKDKGAFARGTALGQQFGSDALRLMGGTVPDSGTPFRTLMANPINGLVSATLGSPVAAAYSSRPVQNALQILASGKRPALATRAAAELEAAAPALSALGITGVNAYRRTNP